MEHHFICDVMDGHGVDGYGHAGIEKLVYRIATFNFEGDLAKSVSGTVSGCFGIEKDEHFVIGFILYQSFKNPIFSVPDAATNCQHDSGSAQGRFFELPGIETDCRNTKDYANYFWNHFQYAFQFSAIM